MADPVAARKRVTRAALNEMTMRQALGAYCASYCTLVTRHHGPEDASTPARARCWTAWSRNTWSSTRSSRASTGRWYEEQQIVEPLARHGFYAGQV